MHPKIGQIVEVNMSSSRMLVLTTTMVSVNITCFQATLEHNSQLWHNRLGHLSYDGTHRGAMFTFIPW